MGTIVNRKFKCSVCSAEQEMLLEYPLCLDCNTCGNGYKILSETEIYQIPTYRKSLHTSAVLSIGKKGMYERKTFKVIGHIRSINNLYVLNEWLLYNEAKEISWLVEANFKYYLFQNTPVAIRPSTYKQKHAGNFVNIEKEKYKILELTKQIEFQFTGQIPENSYNEGDVFKIEAQNILNHSLLSILVFDKNEAEGFKGKPINIKDLNMELDASLSFWK